MEVAFEGRGKRISVEDSDDMTELGTLLVESAIYEAQAIRRHLDEMEAGEKPMNRHAVLGIQPWVDRLDKTIDLLAKVLE